MNVSTLIKFQVKRSKNQSSIKAISKWNALSQKADDDMDSKVICIASTLVPKVMISKWIHAIAASKRGLSDLLDHLETEFYLLESLLFFHFRVGSSS